MSLRTGAPTFVPFRAADSELLMFTQEVPVPFIPRLVPTILPNLVPTIQSSDIRTNKLILRAMQLLPKPPSRRNARPSERSTLAVNRLCRLHLHLCVRPRKYQPHGSVESPSSRVRLVCLVLTSLTTSDVISHRSIPSRVYISSISFLLSAVNSFAILRSCAHVSTPLAPTYYK